jgi:hypothetical protein
MLRTRTLLACVAVSLTIFGFASAASAQGIGGGGTGGGGTGGGGTGGGGTVGGGGGGGGAPGNQFNQQQLELGGTDFEFENIRQARFAGVSREAVVHPYTRVGQNTPILTQGNADTGANTNTPARTQTTGGAAGNFNAFNQFNSPFGQIFGFGGGFGGFGAQQATPVRSTLSFSSTASSHLTNPAVSGSQIPVVTNQALTSRIQSIPGLQSVRASVVLEDRIAVVSGMAQSEEEKSRITRLLRLEPGVSKVVNRMQVAR